ncbi:hypothetical protein MKY37_02480 [Psychrobacillus sp. FSL K6-2836]
MLDRLHSETKTIHHAVQWGAVSDEGNAIRFIRRQFSILNVK